MRALNSYLTILILLISCCLDWSSALFFKSWKSGKGYGAEQNYGNNEYSYGGVHNYANNDYGNYGYGSYAGGYGYNYPSYSSYSHPNGRRKPSGNRQGRTYSQISKVINQAPYVGPGGSRYLPRAPYSALWG
ncbi:heterogeneous nuclear ribonucleoprotein D-like [Drosophila biarmipes]|uniref:heterogeneous nuclear ribonucleoprotein D-like n=1 Tax=Drosophila biarmipes TaxID=125945 RepID=UPI0007E5D574|nr:heterogeneous nuclear ribonucleoprotein D-like [Drosophila biarmipes]